MKVVLFCGGLGLRLREYSDSVPKPLVPIGDSPLIWHVMKYYAHFGHKDFVLCLGHKAEMIKKYFIEYNEALDSDFVLSDGGKNVRLLSKDFQEWRITFVNTGITASVGQRLKAVQRYVEDEDVFLANYVDGLTDLDLNRLTQQYFDLQKTACFLSVRPTQSFHLVEISDGGLVAGIRHIAHADTWINGGYFVFGRRIFDYIQPYEDLVDEPFRRLIEEQELATLKHHGFWACMDTFKEKQQLEDLWAKGRAPWQVWAENNHGKP